MFDVIEVSGTSRLHVHIDQILDGTYRYLYFPEIHPRSPMMELRKWGRLIEKQIHSMIKSTSAVNRA
jgi:hypothetical protein